MGMLPKLLNAVGCIIFSPEEVHADAVSLEEKNTYLLKTIPGSIKLIFLSYHRIKRFLGNQSSIDSLSWYWQVLRSILHPIG